jgi:hypothetical protein
MKGYVWFLTAVMLVFCATVAIPAHASLAQGCSSTTDTWTYAFNMPSANSSFTLVLCGDPYGGNKNYALSTSSSGNPFGPSGWLLGNGGTSNYTDTNKIFEVEVLLEYSNYSGTYTDYSLVAPLSFWATPGINKPFTNDPYDTMVTWVWWDPSSPGNQTWTDLPVGANYTNLNADGVIDPPCPDCTVTITEVAGVPEPGSILMLGSGLAGLAGFLRRKMMRA